MRAILFAKWGVNDLETDIGGNVSARTVFAVSHTVNKSREFPIQSGLPKTNFVASDPTKTISSKLNIRILIRGNPKPTSVFAEQISGLWHAI